MAVFERIDLALVQELLRAATGSGDEIRAVTFENQIVQAKSVPDARISARFTWWFETKTVRAAYATDGHDRQQVCEHARALEGDPESHLFVLTPDPTRPSWFDVLDGVDASVQNRVLWLSFRDLAEHIRAAVGDPSRLLDQQSRFLLNELVALYETDGLLTTDDTVVVAARAAWPEYQRISAYVCQPDRSFREGLTHLGFYTDGAVQPVIARIRHQYPSVLFTTAEAKARRGAGDVELADLIKELLKAKARSNGEAYGVFLLSPCADPDSERLDAPIRNDTKAASGKPWAWTLGQRYTQLDRLRTARTTSEL